MKYSRNISIRKSPMRIRKLIHHIILLLAVDSLIPAHQSNQPSFFVVCAVTNEQASGY